MRKGAVEVTLEDLLKYVVLAMILIAVLLFVYRFSDSTLVFQKYYAIDTAILEDAVTAAPGNVILSYDNLKPDKEFIFTYNDNIVNVDRITSAIKEVVDVAETGDIPTIEYSAGFNRVLTYPDAKLVNPVILFFSKKGGIIDVQNTKKIITTPPLEEEKKCEIEKKLYAKGMLWVEGIAEEANTASSTSQADILISSETGASWSIAATADADAAYIGCLIRKGLLLIDNNARIQEISLVDEPKPTIHITFPEDKEDDISLALRAAIGKYNE